MRTIAFTIGLFFAVMSYAGNNTTNGVNITNNESATTVASENMVNNNEDADLQLKDGININLTENDDAQIIVYDINICVSDLNNSINESNATSAINAEKAINDAAAKELL